MLITKAKAIAMALIIGAGLKYADNDFARIRWQETIKLYNFLYEFSFPDVTRFYGNNPITGLPNVVIFNTPIPGKSSLMNYNPLLESWMYSADAGLTWKRVEFVDYVNKTDCVF